MRRQFIVSRTLVCFMIISVSSLLYAQEAPVGAYISIVEGELSRRAIAPGSEVLIIQSKSNMVAPVSSAPTHHIHNNTYTSQTQELSSSTKAMMQTVIEGGSDFNRNMQKHLLGLWDYTSLYISENRWYIAFGALLGSYGLIVARMLYLSYQLQKTAWWSQWQKEVALSELFARPDEELVDELLTMVQQRYTTSSTLENFSAPIISFLSDVALEEKLLRSYHFWVGVVGYTGFLTKMFPGNKQLIENVQPRLDRIKFLQSRVMHYMSVRKVRKSKK